MRSAVAEVVERQTQLGLDIVNDGEYGKAMRSRLDYGAWISYVIERFTGFEDGESVDGRGRPSGRPFDDATIKPGSFKNRRDRQAFPEVYADIDREMFGGGPRPMGRPIVGEVTYRGHDALKADIERAEQGLAEIHMDRGYIASPVVAEILAEGGDVICKPWVPRNGDLFTKADFTIDVRDMTITCPAGEVQPIRLGAVVAFDPQACDGCSLRSQCTEAALGRGRTVNIAEDEILQQRLRRRMATRQGRQRLRERVAIEHRLAHISQRQGHRARYRGVRKNEYDLRRAATIQNLERIQRRLEDQGKAA